MLKMALLGLLILLSAGVLSAMELSAPPRRAVAIAPPLAEQGASVSASHDALPKADRLDVAAVSSAMPTQVAPVDNSVAPRDIQVGSTTPEPVVRHRRNAKTIAAAERPKPKPKAIVAKRTTNVQGAKAAGETEPCRLKAFGGLLKALNLTGCEI
ncbi:MULTISPECIES: hypothetical protein [Bradyrhizobium]|uniref:Uncharacterized protein n=1 Tax=Bradyrhizobium nanningense TaxID=1325118 RepID=A0A4Q0S498_9BRAD|nr:MULTISPECIES: hypothetical protein [Bradyrhizobium]RXH22502.1 hypothetical protein XH84_34970 [Bradyrhizobium nanningense]RXH26936.1 hypothetical protein XH99_17590 [Bradyrhizobium nanningense]TQF30203.1 hypothetical protein UNPA324_11715 [Bradyrhizobium sp. UNPA324]